MSDTTDPDIFDASELEFDGAGDPDFQPEIPDVPERQGNRYEHMESAEIAALADRAQQVNGDPTVDESLPGPWGQMPDEAFVEALEDAKQLHRGREPDYDSSTELNDENDPGGFRRFARRGLTAMQAGLEGELYEEVLMGRMSVEDAVEQLRRESDAAADEPEGAWALSDTQFHELVDAVKTGGSITSSGLPRDTFAKQAREWLKREH